MNRAGEHGEVVRSLVDSLFYQLLLDEEEATLDASTEIAILDQSGAAVVARTGVGVTVSGSVAQYKRTWDSSTFSREDGYRAVWYLVSSGETYQRELYFDVTRRAFRSQLTDAQIQAINPYVKPFKGKTSLAALRREAWRMISDHLRQRLGTHPGNVFYPENFFKAHMMLTQSRFYFAASFGNEGGEDWDKYEALEAKAYALLNEQLAQVDVDSYPEDGIIDTDERKRNYTGVQLVR